MTHRFTDPALEVARATDTRVHRDRSPFAVPDWSRGRLIDWDVFVRVALPTFAFIGTVAALTLLIVQVFG